MQIKDGLVNVTNGNAVVVGNVDANWNDVVSGDIFTLQSSGVWYEISSRAFVTDHWELTLATTYTGATQTNQAYAVSKSFTPTYTIPYPERGDIETSSLLKRAMVKIDGLLGSQAGRTLQITYTGRPASALVFSLAPGNAIVPAAAASGQQNYSAPLNTVAIYLLTYTEPAATPSGYRLTTLTMHNLTDIMDWFAPSGLASLTSMSFPVLARVGGNFYPGSMALVTTFSFPLLAYVGKGFSPQSMAALTSLSFPELVDVGAIFQPASMALVTTFSFPKLKNVMGDFAPQNMAALTSISVPLLEVIAGGMTIATTFTALTTVTFAGMIAYGGAITIASAGAPNVATLTLGTIGTLKSIAGNITLSGLKIPSAGVNAVLALLVSLDGTGGTTTWGAGKTIDISGGTNGAPTGQGVTDKATLQARGATVTTN
jgi:hypothetical protein